MTPAQLRALIPVGWRAGARQLPPEAGWSDRVGSDSERRVTFSPARDQWFRALRRDTATRSAVILGQDPYRPKGRQRARVLGARRGAARRRREGGSCARPNGRRRSAAGERSLLPWAKRGVLLPEHGAHGPGGEGGWTRDDRMAPVTDAILRAVASQPGPVVFMPWGAHARMAVRRAGIHDSHPHILCPSSTRWSAAGRSSDRTHSGAQRPACAP